MKKLYLSILIFIILFFAFKESSFAYNQDQTPSEFDLPFTYVFQGHTFFYSGSIYYKSNHKIFTSFYTSDFDYSLNGNTFVCNKTYLTCSITSTGSLNWNNRSGEYSYGSTFYFLAYSPNHYDDHVGAGMNLDLSFAFRLTDTNVRLTWDMPEGVDHVVLKIIGPDKTTSLQLSGNSYWFNLFEYGDSQGYLNIYLTPYDSNGNWGNTLTINQLSTDFNALSMVSQFYNGYYRRVTNPAGSGYVDIVGTSDIDVDVVEEKPDSNNQLPSSPTIVRNYHTYSPIFNYNTTNENYYQEVINYYVTNNNVVNNYYYNTVNNIDLSTNITVDYDAYFDIDNVTQTCEDIKDEIQSTGNDFSDLFSLFDVVCPFFGGVGAKAFTLFKWVVGIVGGFVGIKILKVFL